MKKELEASKGTEVGTANDLSEWGEQEGGSQELVIGKILLQQAMSKKVADGEAKLGDYVNSLTGEKMGDFKEDFDIIPFLFGRRWLVSEKKAGANRFTFKRFDAMTSANEKDDWSFTENGVEMKREYCREFYAIDPKNPEMPVLITFKSTSANVGKSIWTQIYPMNRNAGLSPAHFHITIGSEKKEKDGSAFAVSTWKKGEKSTQEEVQKCLEWLKMLKSQEVKIDDSDVNSSAPEASNAGSQQF